MRRNAGMTLLEVMVALVILALIVISISFTFTAAARNASRNRNRVTALGYAVATIEWLRNYVTANTSSTKYQHPQYSGMIIVVYALGQKTTTSYNTPFALDYEVNYSTPLADLNGTRNYTVADIDLNADNMPDLKRVTVTVNWTEP